LRELINIQLTNIKKCYETIDIKETLDEVQKSILEVQMFQHKNTYVSMADITYQSIERYERLQEGNGDKAVKTGFPTIDLLTGGGFRGSKLIIIAGRPRMGKTSLLTTMSRNMALKGYKVGIFSIEMDKEDLDDRYMASETGINTLKLSSGKNLTSEDWRLITEAASTKTTWPIYIDDSGGLTVMELKRRARLMSKSGIQIIFIDQLSKIKSGIKGTEYEQKSYIVNELAELKKELRMPVVLLAQINRKLEDRTIKKPTLGDLKSTGSIEEDSDIVIFIHRNYEYSKKEEEKYEGVIEIAKQRSGPTRSIPVNWTPKLTLFTEKTEENQW